MPLLVQPPAQQPVATATAPRATGSSVLEEFRSEAELPTPVPLSASHVDRRRQWAAVAATSMLIVTVSVGVPALYVRAHRSETDTVAAAAAPMSPKTSSASSRLGPADVVARQEDVDAAPAATAPDDGNYTIVVASFANRERAQRLVEQLTNAGYRAHAVEHDWGPPRGRLLQVNVGSYASADEVQRDLQQIRDLPGGYRDARIVERQ
jgi:cell division septation protein DedD